jgi:hypothetical protein
VPQWVAEYAWALAPEGRFQGPKIALWIWIRSFAAKGHIRFCNVACTLCVGLCAFSELYSAAAIALDRFAPSWERLLGWFLFLLPIELIVALILLFIRKYGRLGFNLTALNILLYAGFLVVDLFAGNATHVDKNDWLMMGLWAVFFAGVLFSARFILAGSGNHSPQGLKPVF